MEELTAAFPTLSALHAVDIPQPRLAAGLEGECDQLQPCQLQRSEGSASTGLPDGPDDLTCAICLEQVDPVDMATIKGCEHLYCVHCILQWAMCKDTARCPQCKTPFTYIFCHRLLDGTVTDFPVEETVTLLKRAKWFEEHLLLSEKGQAMLREAERTGRQCGSTNPDWHVEYYDDFEDEEQDADEEIEKFYFSSAAGRARVFGNRRLGENGFLKSGRLYARPLPTPAPSSGKAKGKGGASRVHGSSAAGTVSSSHLPPDTTSSLAKSSLGASGSQGRSTSSIGDAVDYANKGKAPVQRHAVAAAATAAAAACCATNGSSKECMAEATGSSSSSKAPGRRAKRNARRAVGDDDYYNCDY